MKFLIVIKYLPPNDVIPDFPHSSFPVLGLWIADLAVLYLKFAFCISKSKDV